MALIVAGCCWVPVIFIPGNAFFKCLLCTRALTWEPETFAPVLLEKKAQKSRKVTGDCNIVAPVELESKSNKAFIVMSLTRPVTMLRFEPLVYLNCLYVAVLYSFFYLFFEAYPIIFEGRYLNPLSCRNKDIEFNIS